MEALPDTALPPMVLRLVVSAASLEASWGVEPMELNRPMVKVVTGNPDRYVIRCEREDPGLMLTLRLITSTAELWIPRI